MICQPSESAATNRPRLAIPSVTHSNGEVDGLGDGDGLEVAIGLGVAVVVEQGAHGSTLPEGEGGRLSYAGRPDWAVLAEPGKNAVTEGEFQTLGEARTPRRPCPGATESDDRRGLHHAVLSGERG